METNINEITINGKKYIEAGSLAEVNDEGLTFCIVRTYSAGVFAGYYDVKTIGKIGVVKKAIRIWSWAGAASLSQLAMEGTKKPADCKFAMPVAEVFLTEIIEVIPTTSTAKSIIEGVAIWKM